MKKLSAFETSIIGFFIGVIVAAYVTFIMSSDIVVGKVLSWISLRSVFDMLKLPDSQTMVGYFVFTVVVFTIYGFIIGLITKDLNRSKIVIIPVALVLIGAFIEQNMNKAVIATLPQTEYSAVAIRSVPQVPKQYFGIEAVGDLNADGKDDVAFILHRKDDERGTLYYLTTALSDEKGKTGTNLIFLGDKVSPQNITINNGMIDIILTTGNSTSTNNFYAQVVEGVLEKVTATTTTQ